MYDSTPVLAGHCADPKGRKNRESPVEATNGLMMNRSTHNAMAATMTVRSRMVRFGTAALVCSVFIILGAVVSGAGAAHTLGKLGSIDAIAGSFTVALTATGPGGSDGRIFV